jgi:hypothetical protein
MRAYAYAPGGYKDASTAHKAKPFHREAVFIRVQPYKSTGTWGDTDLLAKSGD